jgi:DNA-binding response OmpR family regulator
VTILRAKSTGSAPRLVLAHASALYAAQCSAYFRRLGWEVDWVRSGEEARQWARDTDPDAVVLATELPDATGWLTCDKLTRDHPGQTVVLLARRGERANPRFAAFVGAVAVVSEGAGLKALGERLHGALILAATA